MNKKCKKIITIKIKRIKYQGNDIGPNFLLNFKIGHKEYVTKKRIKNGKTKTYHDKVATLFSPYKKNQININLSVFESDPIYDDFGTKTIKLNISKLETKQISTIIQIKGKGWEQNKEAVLTIDLEINIDDGVRYIQEIMPDGWLKVTLNSGKIHPLPSLLKVALIGNNQNRDQFVILEGRLKNKLASVKRKGNGHSYLTTKSYHKGPAKLKFYISKKQLWIIGLSKFKVKMPENKKLILRPGFYKIEIPYEPHGATSPLKHITRFATTWFKIGQKGNRFLHIGIHSEGCITLSEHRKWTKTVRFLLRSRRDNSFVGTVEVKK